MHARDDAPRSVGAKPSSVSLAHYYSFFECSKLRAACTEGVGDGMSEAVAHSKTPPAQSGA